VQVSGDELEGFGISSSDYLVVQKRKLAELKPDYGDIIATIVDDKGDQPKLKWSVLDSESDSPPGRIAGIAIAVLKPQGIGAEESAQSPSLRSLRLTPVRLLPVLDEPALTRERPASSRVIFFVQSNRLAVDDQPLSVTPLKDSQITFLPEYDYLTVHISGDSMDQAGISPNDYVILMKSKLVNVMPVSGDIVAVVFRDEDDNKATLKRIRIHHDSVEFRPESSNPAHHSRIVPRAALAGDNPSVEIVGIAIAVLKPQA
jgi:SOS-response transcriptional repressor LexA